MAHSTHDTMSRGRSPARVDDIPDDDDWTVYSDTESVSSCSTVSYDFLPIRNRQERAPTFRFKRGEQSKPVYEAWNIHHFPDRREAVGGSKVLGIKMEQYDNIAGRANVRPQPSTQSELADMHLQAIEGYRAKHKRCWASRAIRGRGKGYEQDLDERCRELPNDVQTAVTQLLLDRGKATSTRYRSRVWTVVVMREQLRNRFVQTDFTEVKRHKLRFWKNTKPETHRLYTIVLRGAETKTASADEPITSFEPLSNPWIQFDSTEIRHRTDQERRQREERRSKRRGATPSYRTGLASYRVRSPSYGTRTRSASPPSYWSRRSRVASPSNRDESPPPYRRSTRSVSPVHAAFRRCSSPASTRSPSVRIRVLPRYDRWSASVVEDAPFPPTPPESFTPPPGVSAYQRPGMPMPPLFPPPGISPFHPRPPTFFRHPMPPSPYTITNPPGSSYVPPGSLLCPAAPAIPPPLPRPLSATPSTCLSCRATRPCGHFLQNSACYRPVIISADGISHHPPCPACATHEDHLEQQQRQQQHLNLLTRQNQERLRLARLDQEEEVVEQARPPWLRRCGWEAEVTMAGAAGAGPQHGIPPPVVYPAPGMARPMSGLPGYTPPYAPSAPSTTGSWASRPPSWYGQPMPPAPNPFSPLSTPPLTSAGGSSPVSERARTPVVEAEGGVQIVPGSVEDGEERGVRVVPMSPTVVDADD